jgi:drug/metabolite transporter (DMT)-like permease
MAVSAFFFSLMSLLVKVASQRLPSQEVVLARAVITLALTWLILLRSGTSPWGTNRPMLVLRGLLGFGGLSSFYFAYSRLPLADATVIQFTNPVITTLLAVWVLNEPLQRLAVGSVLASLVGVVLVARPAFLFGGEAASLDPLAVGVTLFGAFSVSGALLLIRKLRASEPPMVVVFYFALVSTLASIPLALPTAIWPTPMEWLVLLGVGACTQLGQVFVTLGLHLERAGRATAVSYLQVLFAALWGALLFAEYPDAFSLLGGLLILGSTLAVARR